MRQSFCKFRTGSGINQADISKLERGNANPSLKTLKRLAAGMGRTLKVEFARI
ncbi:MAG: helix-turn-helix transcriptional regulator [Treponema sp.]|nr:helix-turn-helix transcriptional regulator [Treponema sp.]